MSSYENFSLRKAERDAICRCCDRYIQRGEFMISGFSLRGQGQHIHLHLDCVVEMSKLVSDHRNI